MKNQILSKYFFLSCILLLICSCVDSKKLDSWIIDNDQIFNSDEFKELNTLLDSINRPERYNILIHTIAKDSSDRTFETISDSIFDSYTLSKPFYLISISKSYRNVSVTFDIDDLDKISYEKTDSIIVNYMIPSLKNSNYKKACENAIMSLGKAID